MKIVGKTEYISLPSFEVHQMLAKVDTGSFYGVLDAHCIEIEDDRVTFDLVLDSKEKKRSQARLAQLYEVKSSNGHEEQRPLICIPILLGDSLFKVHFSLRERQHLSCRALIGREILAIAGLLVDVRYQRPLRV